MPVNTMHPMYWCSVLYRRLCANGGC